MALARTKADTFGAILAAVRTENRAHHRSTLVEHARQNRPFVGRTLRDLPVPDARSGVVVSAGPSLRRRDSIRRLRDSNYEGVIIAVDASFAACLREGVTPDFVLTVDPHPTRMVRWFGDPQWEKNSARDDYFARQDLDVEFRRNAAARNQETIDLVNEHGPNTTVVVSSSSPPNVVERLRQAQAPLVWWNPLVDDPREPGSLTRALYEINGCPCLNTGGNVGTAAWVFATTTLQLPAVGLLGMDFGYYGDTRPEQTQMYYEYKARLGPGEAIEDLFVHRRHPLTGAEHFTDPTYHWYAQNFRELMERARGTTVNCTEGGVLEAPGLEDWSIEDFAREYR